jgi:hypothetical protein
MRGRLPSGPDYVEKLSGSEEARQRLQVILQTLAGSCRVQEACDRLGIGVARFHQLRLEALQAAVDQLEPRAAGRPARPPQEPRIASMQEEIEQLRLELQAARTRAEIALVLPGLANTQAPAVEDAPGKKPPRRRTRRRPPPSPASR